MINGKLICILLGGTEEIMSKRFENTIKFMGSYQQAPLVFISGTISEEEYYLERCKEKGLKAFSSHKAYDTFTNFSKDIKSLLKKLDHRENLVDAHLIVFSGMSHGWRVTRVLKYMIHWDRTFRLCSFRVYSKPEIPDPPIEPIVKIFYYGGYVGMFASRVLSLYRKWKTTPG